MTTSDDADHQSSDQRDAERERRRRLAAAFGDAVPDQTSDDVDPREDRSGKGDDWYREQVPPHHG
ncbi:hypothetical protein L2K70_01905 [Nocardioides KLBMP 9356]|uniref:Uncharacterized protein n=1 Tax=Nocardioides potassii TaxID=2911371 RepID=A0ABS9H811_9ACTN|nr:hypothetical protein [Nocardioides potassii]MCF6376351.1 hypothetical protein [Nocardioides potassii]